MTLSAADINAILLTVKLAFTVTAILMLIGTPLAWWLSRTKHWSKGLVSTVVALPLVLPPTVIGFYLLLLLGPQGAIGQLMQNAGLNLLPFTFWGLVVASMVYSLPFVVQPLVNSFSALSQGPYDAASTLRTSPFEQFFTITLPLAKSGFISAAILGFAHTVGEFGVVLMIGGNIPDETRVVSIQLYDHVEALAYDQAHALAMVLVVFSFIVLFAMYQFTGSKTAFSEPRKP